MSFNVLMKTLRLIKDCVVGRKMVPQRCTDPNLQILYLFTLPGRRDFAGMIKVIKEFKLRRVAWIIQRGPVKSHESLKANNIF